MASALEPVRGADTHAPRPDSAKVIKSVKFAYAPTPLARELLGTFRDMVNEAIRICLLEGIKGRLGLRDRIYKEFQERYNVVSCFPYSVAEVAWSIVKKHRRWHRKPFAKRLMLKMDSANYSLNYGIIGLPNKKGQRVLIPLKYGDWQRSFLMDTTLKRGAVTMTENAIIIAFSKETTTVEPSRKVGYDLNHASIVGSDGIRIDLSQVARLHTEYGVRRSEFYKEHPNDRRLKQKFASSRRERERVNQALNVVSKQVVEKAVKNREAIILEKLRGFARQAGKGMRRGAALGEGLTSGRSDNSNSKLPTRQPGPESRSSSSLQR